MKCPKCSHNSLQLYKEVEVVYRIPLNKNGTLPKSKVIWERHKSELDSEKDFLECMNNECQQWYDYELNENGKVIIIDERDISGF
jgi:hypothetical protein